MSNKVLLMILDGWGIGTNPKASAIAAANTPFIDSCYQKYPNAKLKTSGMDVGLPEGQMGNSEVGHINIGAGRVVYQNLAKINLAVTNNTLGNEPQIKKAFEYAKNNQKNIHLIGLVSNGGVHSHINHLKALLQAAKAQGISQNLFVHAFTDGRDCDPKSGKAFMQELLDSMQQSTGQLASICGRYYAMDRDQRWERVKLAYDVMVNGIGTKTQNPIETIQDSYDNQVTDEFIKPIVCTDANQQPIAKIQEGDVVFCFNFRTDRGREITEALSQKDFPDFGMKKLNLYYLTMTNYDKSFNKVNVVFDEDTLNNTLGQVLANNNKTQIRIAETEKYPHVTFFFSGGREIEFDGESRILCPSPKDVATYDLKPEMSAHQITNNILPELRKSQTDFVCLNFANPDMVGHTGVFSAAVKACEVVDACAEEITKTATENGYSVLIIADHGNSDLMINPDGSPNTQHTTNLVPLILAEKENRYQIKDGKLGDIAPTILTLMGIEVPAEMTGEVLISKA